MDLASFLNISLQPIIETTLYNEMDVPSRDKDFVNVLPTISQLERQAPSVIKEEDEHREAEHEESTDKFDMLYKESSKP